jgi:hypothetical protein
LFGFLAPRALHRRYFFCSANTGLAFLGLLSSHFSHCDELWFVGQPMLRRVIHLPFSLEDLLANNYVLCVRHGRELPVAVTTRKEGSRVGLSHRHGTLCRLLGSPTHLRG